MPVLPSAIDPTAAAFAENERAMREGLELVRSELEVARAGGGPGRAAAASQPLPRGTYPAV